MADKQTSLTAIQATWIGPVPPPETIAYYQKLVPNAGERLFVYAENEMLERHKLQHRDFDIAERDMKAHYKSVLVGQITSFII